jgi:serine/threonine protein kinase
MYSELEDKKESQILDKFFKRLAYQHKKKWVANLYNEAGFSIKRNKEELIRAYPAFKCFFKYACYLDELGVLTGEHKSRFMAWHDMLLEQKYTQIKNEFDALFSESDWEKVRQFFQGHPNESHAGSKNKLMYSYLKSKNLIIRRNIKPVGEGVFGRVTDSCTEEHDMALVTKRQSSHVKDFYLKDCILEAQINLQLGIAYTDLIVRMKHGEIYKVYQVMHHLGEPLLKVLRGKSFDIKLDYIIKLLLAVRDLHSGVNGDVPFAHCDIKPDNVLINQEKKTVHLIDFGLSQQEGLDDEAFLRVGSMAYWPSDLNKKKFRLEMPTTRFFDDTVAVLRTVYYPKNSLSKTSSILNHDEFYSLPKVIQDLIDTTIVTARYSKDTEWTVSLVAAALILFQNNQQSVDEILIYLLSQNSIMQDQLIDFYTKGLTTPTITIDLNEEDTNEHYSENQTISRFRFFRMPHLEHRESHSSLFSEWFNCFKNT